MLLIIGTRRFAGRFSGRFSIELDGTYLRIGSLSLYAERSTYRPAKFIEVCGPQSGLCGEGERTVFLLGWQLWFSRRAQPLGAQGEHCFG